MKSPYPTPEKPVSPSAPADVHALAEAHKGSRLAVSRSSAFFTKKGIALPSGKDPMVVLVPDPPMHSRLVRHKVRMLPLHDEGSAGLPTFEGGEHTYIGNTATLFFSGSDPGHPAATTPLHLPNGLALTYGQIVALGGDFYGLPDAPISDDPNPPARFLQAFNTLAAAPAAVAESARILQIMQVEIDAVNQALQHGQQPSTVYAQLGDELSKQWNVATGGGSFFSDWVPTGRYLDLAATNWDHFGTHAVAAYTAGHGAALAQAVVARGIADPAARQTALELAYAMNAFADHFLSDLFSSGHLRTPRKELYSTVTPSTVGSLLSRYMHDEDCKNGLNVQNANGDAWKAYGDKRYFDTVDTPNANMVDHAVQVSVDEVFQAFNTGQVPAPAQYGALALIADLAAVSDFNDFAANYSPLFISNAGTVQRRNDINDLNDHSWTSSWWGTTTLALLEATYGPDGPPTGTLIPPLSAPAIDPAGWQSSQPMPPNWINGNQVRYAVSFVDGRSESELGPYTPYTPLNNTFFPTLVNVPVDTWGQAIGRRVYRQFGNGPLVCIAQIHDNTTTTYVDINA